MQSDYVSFLLEVYEAILKDCSVRYPKLSAEFSRDMSRLRSNADARGLKFFTLDLPALGKHFDACLGTGRLTRSGLPGSLPSHRRGVIPRLFRGITQRVFSVDGFLLEDVDTEAIRLLRQLYYCSKKLKVQCDEHRTLGSVREFFDIDYATRVGTLDWDSDYLGEGRSLRFGDSPSTNSPPDCSDLPLFQKKEALADVNQSDVVAPSLCDADYLNTLQCVCDIFSHFLGEFIPEDWKGRHGPGAVSDQQPGNSKYEFPNWPDKLASSFPLDIFAYANMSVWVDEVSDESVKGRFSSHEPPAKLIAVPKSQKGPRLIASEPICHQWCQQAVRAFLVNGITKSPLHGAISLRDQSINQRLAMEASQSGAWTIDLSSASDRLSCWVVERTFRRNPGLLTALHAIRTRWIVNTIDKKSPKFHKLRKFACMGSAVTFPVQSIVYLAVVVAAILKIRNVRATIANVRDICTGPGLGVFGDDIIVPNDPGLGVLVLEALAYLGFEVNKSKTFGSGRFRESCGLDAYDGTNVTPSYVSTIPERPRPESVISCIEVSNNFARRGWFHVAQLIKTTVVRVVGNDIPNLAADSGLLGWKHSLGEDNSHLRKRWCHRLQKTLHCVLVPRSRSKATQQRGSSSLLQFFTEDPSPTTKWESGVKTRPLVSLNKRWEELT